MPSSQNTIKPTELSPAVAMIKPKKIQEICATKYELGLNGKHRSHPAYRELSLRCQAGSLQVALLVINQVPFTLGK